MSTRRRSNSRSPLAGALFLAALLPAGAAGQSAQMLSFQFSGLGMYPFGGEMSRVDVGAGWEAQLRLNPSAFSIGAGAEQTFHKRVTGHDIVLLGGFVEPRYVLDIGSDNAVMYLSARGAVSQVKLSRGSFQGTGTVEGTSTGFTLNGGGGLLFRLSDRVNLDAGVTVGFKKLGTIGSVDLGTGANAVGRLGLAIGVR